MRTFFQLTVLTLFLIAPILVQAQSVTKAPVRVEAAFNAKYPKASQVNWEETYDAYNATFAQEGRQHMARFNNSGQWISTRAEMQENDWPKFTRNYLSDEFPNGYTYREGYRIEDKQGTRMELKLNDGSRERTFRFDDKGRFVDEIE